MLIRPATPNDAEPLARLLRECLRESYPGHPGSSAEDLRRDIFGPTVDGRPRQSIIVAETGGDLVGLVAWDTIYDMHWATFGAQVADFYVAPAHRGRGLAVELRGLAVRTF